MSEQTANLCTTDACESLRARLAKYEDAEGRAVAVLPDHERAKLVNALRDCAKTYAGTGQLRAQIATVLGEFIPLNSSPVSAGDDAQYPPCDYCAEPLSYHPWHGSGLINGVESRHIHACDKCRHLLPGGIAGGVDERAAFDEWFAREVWKEGCYGNQDILKRQLWPCWQARAALTASAPNDQYRDLVWMAHQLADMVLKGDAPHTAVRVAKSLMRECEGKASAPNHSEQVRELTLEEVTVERDFMGTIHIKSGDFDFIQIQYQYPYTDNAGTWKLAEQIAALLATPSAGSQGGDQ